jgi:hypothetical protein
MDELRDPLWGELRGSCCIGRVLLTALLILLQQQLAEFSHLLPSTPYAAMMLVRKSVGKCRGVQSQLLSNALFCLLLRLPTFWTTFLV